MSRISRWMWPQIMVAATVAALVTLGVVELRSRAIPTALAAGGGQAQPAGAAAAPAAQAAPPATAAQSAPTPQAQAGTNVAEQLSAAFEHVVAVARPSLVSIRVEKALEVSAGDFPEFFGMPFEGSPFERFFRFHGGQKGQPRRQLQKGAGTGFIIRGDGYIVTNHHVVRDADKVIVTLPDERELPGRVAGRDPRTDVAVIKVEAKGLTPARFGSSEALRVGQWVVAVGDPFGLERTVTVGVVSAKGRFGLGNVPYEDFIQTDASINPGNSGGPLLNLRGEVIGINTMIAGIGTGIGFAIPSDLAGPVVEQLLSRGKVVRAWLGLGIQELTVPLAKSLGRPPHSGALVSQVHPGSPAAKVDLQPGDVVTAIDGQPVKESRDLVRRVLVHKVGERVALTVVRGGAERKLQLATAEMPEDVSAGGSQGGEGGSGAPGAAGERRLGLQLQPLPEGDRIGGAGVRVAGVEPGSPAAEGGLRPGDIVLSVNQRPVRSPEEVRAALKASREFVLLRVKREERTIFVAVPWK